MTTKTIRPVHVAVSADRSLEVSLLGKLPFTVPPDADLQDCDRAAIEWACFCIENDDDDMAARLLARIQRRFGVTQEAHIAGALLAFEVDAQGRRKPHVANDPIELPDRERGFSPDVVKHFDRTRTRLLNATKDDTREVLSRSLARIERAPKEAAEKDAIEEGVAESIRLAESRGEEIVRDRGDLAIATRDGLRALYVDERLTEAEYLTAKKLRGYYEAREGDTGSQLGSLSGGAGHDNDRFVKARLTRAKATDFIARLERRIAVKCAKRPSVLTVLRWVIGQGHSIRPLGGGRTYYRNIEALLEAIALADDLEQEDRAKAPHQQPA